MPNANHDIDDYIRRSTQVDVPAQVKERMQRQLRDLREKVEHRRSNRLRECVWPGAWLLSFRVPLMAAAALTLAALVWMIIPSGLKGGRVYAAAAEKMRAAHSLEYTIELAPGAEVHVSYLAPAYRRIRCSWGIEVRSDGTGKELVLMHSTRNYLIEKDQHAASFEDWTKIADRLKSLPESADENLGIKHEGSIELIGFRVRHVPEGTATDGFRSLDIWVNAATRIPDRIDISFQEQGKSPYQMHIRDIHIDPKIDRSLFSMTPPAGYTAIKTGDDTRRIGQAPQQAALHPEIKHSKAMTAVVVPAHSSYAQAKLAMHQVESRLKNLGAISVGPRLMQYESATQWSVGCMVQAHTLVKAPLRRIEIPAGPIASVVVKGPWGQDFNTLWGHDPGSRWASFIMWIGRQGYVPAGPPTEIWFGNARQSNQSTEMRIAVKRR